MYLCDECKLDFPTADDAVEHHKKTGHGYKRIRDAEQEEKGRG